MFQDRGSVRDRIIYKHEGRRGFKIKGKAIANFSAQKPSENNETARNIIGDF